MTRRFSSRELTFLRNKVPINRVIENMLSVATGNKNGAPSFNCPACHSANTCIHTRHNLARCFDCRRNFNPIEFVMHQRHISFVDSVKWLERQSRNTVAERVPILKESNTHPVSIGEILSEMIPSLNERKAVKPVIVSLSKRLSDLEHRVQQLDSVVKKLILNQR